MDSKSIFARTSKGEDEIRSKTAHLSGDIKRSLLMVDGTATFGEISKRAAPSLRSSLEDMFNELLRDGFIHEKDYPGKISKKSAPSGMVSKMVVPSSKSAAAKMPEDDEGDNDLDFASEYRPHAQEVVPVEADKGKAESEAEAHALAQAKAKQKAEAQSRVEADAETQARAKADAKARRELEAKAKKHDPADATDTLEVQARALQEARERAESKARQGSGASAYSFVDDQPSNETDEIARLEAEAKVQRDAEAKARAELIAQERALEAARARVEAEAKARREAEARARAEAEAKAKREAEARARAEAEAKAKREAEARARAEADAKARREAEAKERAEAEADTQSNLGQELEVGLEPFLLSLPDAAVSPSSNVEHTGLGLQKADVALMNDIGKIIQPGETDKQPADSTSVQKQEQEIVPASEHTANKTPAREKVKSEAAKHKPSAYEVQILEEKQSKVWAEAEQRAKEDSKAKALWDVDLPPESQPAAKKAAPVARVKRKPLPWLKLAAGIVALALIVLFVAPFLVPTKQYIPEITRLLGGKLHQPFYVSRLEWRLLPTPRLDLIDIAIGNNKQIQAKLARMDFSIPALFTAVKSINSLELEGVEVDAAALQQASELLQLTAADAEFPIARILLKDGKLEAEGYALSGVGGELNFNHDGKFTHARFRAEGNKYEWEVESAPLYKTRVKISVHGSSLPLLQNWVFDELTANGEINGNELVVTELDGHIMGGTVHGSARLGWRSGWIAQGSLAAKTVTMQNMLKVMSGTMDGTARFRMQSESLAKLADEAKLEGSFVIKDGVINGIDIAETARLHRKENMPGGRTHFDELSGDMSYDKGAYAFRNLKLGAGVLEANGKLDYSGQQVAGSINAVLDFHQAVGPVPLELGGTNENPTLITR